MSLSKSGYSMGGGIVSTGTGIAFITSDPQPSTTFEFGVVPGTDQIDLKCQRGCVWEQITVDCRDNQCIATVDETGVSLGPQLPDTDQVTQEESDYSSRIWPQCLVEHLAITRASGGPVTFEIAFDEAREACKEAEEKFRSNQIVMDELAREGGNFDEMFLKSFQHIWDQLPDTFPQ